MSGLPATYNMTVSRGKTITRDFRLKIANTDTPVAITPETKVRGQIREEEGVEGITTTTTLLLDLTEGNGRLEITDRTPQGVVRLLLSSDDSIALDVDNVDVTRYYEIEFFDDSGAPDPDVVTAFIAGKICLKPEIARE